MKRWIKNVFISNGSNDLKLVDICFEDKILEIVSCYNQTITWNSINTEDKRNQFIKQLGDPAVNESNDFIDGRFLLLMPGAIDAHVHFNTPGFEDREDFEHGSLSAAYGGVTTVIDMPCTSLPPITSSENLEYKLNSLKNRSLIDYALWGGVRGNDFSDAKDINSQIKELTETGVVGFKVYMTSGMDTFKDLSDSQLSEAARLIKNNNGIMAVHAEDKILIETKYVRFLDDGKKDWRAYCASHNVEAEIVAVNKLIKISGDTGCRVHVVHLSSSEGLKLIREAQSIGITVTTETCPHYLFFTQNDFQNPKISAYLKTAPPVKFEEDKEALWEGLSDGTISFVTTDHAGCDPLKEKTGDDFWKIYGGIPGVEHRVPFLFSEGLFKRNLTISKIIDLLSSNAAAKFNLKQKGNISVGKDADFALIDLWNSNYIKAEEMHSKGKYTPFEGVMLNALVEKTILRGKIIMDRKGAHEVKYGYGSFVKSN